MQIQSSHIKSMFFIQQSSPHANDAQCFSMIHLGEEDGTYACEANQANVFILEALFGQHELRWLNFIIIIAPMKSFIQIFIFGRTFIPFSSLPPITVAFEAIATLWSQKLGDFMFFCKLGTVSRYDDSL